MTSLLLQRLGFEFLKPSEVIHVPEGHLNITLLEE